VIAVSTKLAAEFGGLGGRIFLPIAAMVIVTLATFFPKMLAILAVVGLLIGWFYIVQHDYVLALAVFMAMMPLWLFLKWVEWPSVLLGGSTIHLATMLKEVLMIVFFSHWLVSAVRKDQAFVRVPLALLGFFGFVAMALLQGGIARYPMLIRPYVETFLLIAVPLLSIELSRHDVERLLIGMAVGGGITAVLALFHAVVDPKFLLWDWLIREEIYKTRGGLSAYFGPRLQSFTGNPNNLGQLMLLTGVLSYGLAFRDSFRSISIHQLVFGSIFAISSVILMLSRSRDDIAFLAMGIAIFVIIQRRFIPLLCGALVFGVSFFFNIDQIVGVFERLLSQGNPRFDTWLSGIHFYGWELLTGVGQVENQFRGLNNPYDSSYFRIIIQTGIGGLLLFILATFGTVSRLLIRSLTEGDSLKSIVLVLLIVLLGGMLFRVSLLVFPFSIYFWTFLSLGIRLLSDFETIVTSDIIPGANGGGHR